MALLSFSDEEQYLAAIDYMNEIIRLGAEISKMKVGSEEWKELNSKLTETRRCFNQLVDVAIKSGAELEMRFQKEIVSASSSVEEFSMKLKNNADEIKRTKDRIKELREENKKLVQEGKSIKKNNITIGNLQDKLSGLYKTKVGYEGDLARSKNRRDQAKMSLNKLREDSSQRAVTLEIPSAKDLINTNREGNKMKDWVEEVAQDGKKIKSIFTDIASTVAGVSLGKLAADGLIEGYRRLSSVISNALRVRSEMQDVESNMGVFLKSKEKAASFTRDLEAEAYYNMNEFSQLVAASKEMIAYGNNVKEIIPRIHQLSEIATGTGQNMNMLVSMYNRAKSIGYVDSRTQQTWASNGIVLQDQLRAMGETANGTKVTFEQLNKVIDKMTSEGGMFYGVMADMMSNISAEEGQLEDNLHTMYNEIGKLGEEGYIKVLKNQEWMAQNWREIAEYIGAGVAALGAYRTALVAAKVIQEAMSNEAGDLTKKLNEFADRVDEATKDAGKKGLWGEGGNLWDYYFEKKEDKKEELKEAIEDVKDAAEEATDSKLAEAASTATETAAETANTAAQTANASATNKSAAANVKDAASEAADATATTADTTAKVANTAATKANAASQNLLTAALWRSTKAMFRQFMVFITNPYVLIGLAIAGLIAYVVKLSLEMSKEERVTKDVNEAMKEHAAAVKEAKDEEEKLCNTVTDTNLSMTQRIKALKELKELYDGLEVPEGMVIDDTFFEKSEKEQKQILGSYRKAKQESDDKEFRSNNSRAVEILDKYSGYSSEHGANAMKKNADGTYSTIRGEEMKKDFDALVSAFNPEWLDPNNKESPYKNYADDARLMLEYFKNIGQIGVQNNKDIEEAIRLEQRRTMTRREYWEMERENYNRERESWKKAQGGIENYVDKNEIYTNKFNFGNVLGNTTTSINEASKKARDLSEELNRSRMELNDLYLAFESASNDIDKEAIQKDIDKKKEEFIGKMKETGLWITISEALESGYGSTASNGEYIPSENVEIGVDFVASYMADNDITDSMLRYVFNASEKAVSKDISLRYNIVTSQSDGNQKDGVVESENYVAETDIPTKLNEMKTKYRALDKGLEQIKNDNFNFDENFLKEIDGLTAKTSKRKFTDIIKQYKETKEINDTDLLEFIESLNQEIGNTKTSFTSAGGKNISVQEELNKEKEKTQNREKLANERLTLRRKQVEAENQLEQNAINNMAQGAERQRRQRELDHKKAMEQITKNFEDEKKKALEDARTRWETAQKIANDGKLVRNFNAETDTDDIYDKAIAVATSNYNVKRDEQIAKNIGGDAVIERYNKSKNEYAKKIGEFAVDLSKLQEERNRLNNIINNPETNEKDKASAVERVNDVNNAINNLVKQQEVLLDATGKAKEAFIKEYGTIYDKISVIENESKRKLAEGENFDDWSILASNVEKSKNIIDAYKNDKTMNDASRLAMVDREYANALEELDKVINENHKKALDEKLSEEERANARSLELAGVAAKQRMEMNRLEDTKSITLEGIKRDPTYFAAMQNPSSITEAARTSLLSQLQGRWEELSNLDPSDLKVLTDMMDKIVDVDIKKDPYKVLTSSSKEFNAAQLAVIESKKEYNDALEEQKRLQEELFNLEALAKQYANDETIPQEVKEETNRKIAETTAALSASGKTTSDAWNKVQNNIIRATSALNTYKNASDALKKQATDLSNGFKSLASAIRSADLGNDGEVAGLALDIVGEIIDDIVKIQDEMDKFDDKLSVETQMSASNNQLQAAELQSQAADKQLQAAKESNTNISGGASGGSGEGSTEGAGSGLGAKMSSALSAASSIMAGISMGMSIGTKVVSLFQKTGVTGEEKYEKYATKLGEINKLKNSVIAYQKAALAAKQAEEHWFGNTALQGLIDSWSTAELSMNQYYTKLNEQQAAYRDQTKHDGDWIGNVVVGSIAGAVTGFAVGNIYGAIVGGIAGGIAGATTSYAEQALGNNTYQKDAVKAQDNLRIETRSKKKSFMWIGGHDQQTTDLRTWAKEKYGADLFDENGMINTELGEEILENYSEKLQGQTEATIRQLMELSEQYKEYEESLKDYVNSLYSPLSDAMTDAIWTWLDSGKDALAEFQDAAASTFKNIANDMLKQLVMENVFGTYEDDIKELYKQYSAKQIDESTLMEKVSQATKGVMLNYETQLPVLQNMAQELSNVLEDTTGVDIINSTSGSGTGSVAANVTQDSIDETNGRMSAIQMITQQQLTSVTEIRGDVSLLLSEATDMNYGIVGIREQMSQSFLEVQGIHEDTTFIRRNIKFMIDAYFTKWDEPIKSL